MATEHGVECKSAVVDGVSPVTIANYAEKNDADAIVLESHGHGRFDVSSLFLESTADRVVHHAQVPSIIPREEDLGAT